MFQFIRNANLIAMALIACCLSAPTLADDAADMERQFRELPMEARRLTGPLFWLHGDETPEQLERTLQKVLEGGNGMFIAESRPHNDWLGPGWFRDLDICLDFARKNDLQMIIFDDPWWPSQMMGGRVLPEFGSKSLVAIEEQVTGPQELVRRDYGQENLLSIVAGKVVEGDTIDGESLVNLTNQLKQGTLEWDVPEGEWKIMKFSWKRNGANGAQVKMVSVDGASPDCVEWFINAVYKPHYDRYKEDFGKTIVGFFYDEPETQGDWGTDLPVLAKERGLDMDQLMVGYKYNLSGEDRIAAKHEYLDLFAESWGRTMYGGISKWCQKHGVLSMGHFMEHSNCIYRRDMSGGNMMQLQKYSDMGGIDLVCRQVYPGERKMDMYQMPKIASSLSRTYGKKDDIALCEIYGGYNQVLTYPQMKWLADWHHVRGVNLLNTHSFNPRAPYDRDYPPYFYNGGFEPRWPLYRVWADYTNRLTVLLTGGRHECPVAFLHTGQSLHVGKVVRPEQFTSTLQDALFDCDWFLHDAWMNSTIEGDGIVLGDTTYRVLVVPPVEVIPYPTLAKAKEFFEAGGVVVGYDFLPTKSGSVGKSSSDIAALTKAIWGESDPGLDVSQTSERGGRSYFLPAKTTSKQVQQVLTGDAKIRPTLEVVEGETNDWLHVMHRVKHDRDIFLVCNQDHVTAAKTFRLRADANGVPELWDAMRGQIHSLQHNSEPDGSTVFSLTLEPMESAVVVFQPRSMNRPPVVTDASPSIGMLVVERKPNLPSHTVQIPKVPSPGPRITLPTITQADPFRGAVSVAKDWFGEGRRIYLVAEDVPHESAASVKINGEYVGGFIGKPYRLDVTKHLNAGENRLLLEPFAPAEVRLECYPEE